MSDKKRIKRLEEQIAGLKEKVIAQKKIEKQIVRREKLYRSYFHENVSGLYISTPEGKLIICNNEFLNIFGFIDIRHAMETSMDKLYIDPEDRNEFLNLLLTEKQVTGYESNRRKLDGTPIHLVENASPVFDKNGNLEYFRGFLRDVTEQKTLENQLRGAQKMEAIGALAGGIAHDFNNILSGIFGNAQLAESRIHAPEKAKVHIRNIVTGAQRASELVQQILTFSKQTEYKKNYLNLDVVIKDVVKFIRSTIPTSIEIKTQIRKTQAVLADHTQMHRLLMNLCTNAYHAMQNTGGVLTIELDELNLLESMKDTYPDMPCGDYLELQVADTGHGIDDENMEQIFNPYFTTNVENGGTGIGLASVQSIVQEHNGFIKVDSAIGKGSRFFVFLPILTRDKGIADVPEKEGPLSRGSGTVMIVDDEETIRFTLKQILEDCGFCTLTYQNGADALAAFNEEPEKFDLILSDMNMPKMSGDQLAAKALAVRNEVPIVLCTGYSAYLNKEKAKNLGACRYLQKPVKAGELITVINNILDENKKK